MVNQESKAPQGTNYIAVGRALGAGMVTAFGARLGAVTGKLGVGWRSESPRGTRRGLRSGLRFRVGNEGVGGRGERRMEMFWDST
jgi:hypothetical protein